VPTQCLLPAIDSSLKSPVDGKSCRRERRRRNDFDEALTLREPGRPKEVTLGARLRFAKRPRLQRLTQDPTAMIHSQRAPSGARWCPDINGGAHYY
jgi:hypothetical protein